MSVTNFSELKTEVAALYGDRTDVAVHVAGFIQRAEERIRRLLRTRDMFETTTLTSASSVLTAPTGMVRPVSIRQSEANKPRIDWTSYTEIEQYLSEITETGDPCWAAVYNGTIYLAAAPADGVVFRLGYLTKLPALSDSQTTNWLLTDHSDVYVYATLRQAALYDQDEGAAADYTREFMTALGEVQSADNADQYGEELIIRPNGGVA